jgi:hypothetical protein
MQIYKIYKSVQSFLNDEEPTYETDLTQYQIDHYNSLDYVVVKTTSIIVNDSKRYLQRRRVFGINK